jgi:hypothetical protein
MQHICHVAVATVDVMASLICNYSSLCNLDIIAYQSIQLMFSAYCLPSPVTGPEKALQVALGIYTHLSHRWCQSQRSKCTALQKQHQKEQTCLMGMQWGWARSQ